jgi:hypothetical protein
LKSQRQVLLILLLNLEYTTVSKFSMISLVFLYCLACEVAVSAESVRERLLAILLWQHGVAEIDARGGLDIVAVTISFPNENQPKIHGRSH